MSYRIPDLGEPGFFITSLNEKESKANVNMSIAGVEAFVGGNWSLGSGFESQVEARVEVSGDRWDT